MKKLSCSILLIIILCSCVSAQDDETGAHAKSAAVKFAPAGIIVGTVSIGAEYNFKHRNSLTLVAGFPFDKKNNIEIDGKKSGINSKVFTVLAGYRHYLGAKTMSGFYVEPFLKYVKLDAKGLLNKELQGQNAIFDTHANYEGFGLGVQLGVQFIVAKLLVFDLFLLGPEANSIKATTFSTDITDVIPWSYADAQQVETDIKDYLKDIPVIGDKTDVTVNTVNKTVATRYNGFMPGFRAGASIGIRF